MMGKSTAHILENVPSRFRGPGGAVAVVENGKLAGQKAWGFADLEKHTPMAEDTVLPICSITKQMLCGIVTDLELNPSPAMIARGGDPGEQLSKCVESVLDGVLLKGTGLTIRHLCNNQSGIRDYWALTVLWGAKPEDRFSIEQHGPQVLKRMNSLHFEPGDEYAYSNTNYFILARTIEKATEQTLETLLSERIFGPAGMTSARLCADTANHPPPCVGYEGDENFGFYPAVNRIEWAGDAGIAASLTDMIAYEQSIDSTNETPEWYQKNSKRQHFNGGTPANYGYGLARKMVGAVETIGHGGALRGYRLYRLYAPEPRISVVALLNQEHGDSAEVCEHILKQMLSIEEVKHDVVEPGPNWTGTYLDPESQLAITIAQGVPGQLLVKYHRKADKLRVVAKYQAESDDMVATLDGDSLIVKVPSDNRTIRAARVAASTVSSGLPDIAGRYHCDEIDSTLQCTGTGSMMYGSFEGFLGHGPAHLMRPLAKDIWALACPRAMDSTPPGDWSVIVQRDESGMATGLTIGCWLARKLQYTRI